MINKITEQINSLLSEANVLFRDAPTESGSKVVALRFCNIFWWNEQGGSVL